MKIAYLAVKGIPMSGGIEKYTDLLASKLVSQGHEVTVYTSRHYGNVTGEYHGYMIRALPSLKGKFLEKISLVFMASVDQLFRDYDVVHYHALGPSVFAFMAKWRRRKVVIQSHGIEYQRAKWGSFASRVLKMMERISYNMGDVLTVVSKPIQKYFLDTYGKETVFIPTGVELPDMNAYDEYILEKYSLAASEYYLFIARIVEEKGLHYLIKAYRDLHTDKKLVIAGKMDPDNPYHKELKKMAVGDERIVFLGEVLGAEKDMLYKGAYAFCLPSELEGMSIALLEAMSYGKVCIVSDIPENLDVAEGHSYIFENKNPDSLLQTLRCVESASEEEREACSKSARLYVEENHQFALIAELMEKLYSEI